MSDFSSRRGNDSPVFDVAEICLNGHVTNPGIYHLFPGNRYTRCETCGEPTIIACPHCGHEISRRLSPLKGFVRPTCCRECGELYPWVERRLAAARELVDEQKKLSDQEKEELKNTLPDLVEDTPRTREAALRAGRLFAQAGIEALGVFRNILVDIASETAKMYLFPIV